MIRRNQQPGYSNLTDRTVISYRVGLEAVELPITSELATVAFESVPPVRSVPSWKGKNVYEGDYWSSTTRGFVHHESLLEREYLMSADFALSITAVSWQPFVLRWPHGTKGHRGHVPDYFCRRDNGDGVVVDVKRSDQITKSELQFSMTREVCEGVGWEYQVFSGIPEPRLTTLTFLSGFRQDRYSPSADSIEALLEAFTPAVSLQAGVDEASRVMDRPTPVVHGNVLHLLWMGLLIVDFDTPLDLTSMVHCA